MLKQVTSHQQKKMTEKYMGKNWGGDQKASKKSSYILSKEAKRPPMFLQTTFFWIYLNSIYEGLLQLWILSKKSFLVFYSHIN